MIPLVIMGSISGAVVFDGKAPARKDIERDVDPVCARTKEQTRDVIVTDGKLRDVLVHVVKGAKPDAPPATPVVVAQHDCEYEPRVSAILLGQRLAVHNGDPTYHNVHGSLLGGKNLWNESQPAGEPDLVEDVPSTVGAVVSLHCDVHAWMQAYAVVVDNAHFAVTGDDGTFTLPDLAPGTYTVEAWHPKLGTRTATIKIGTGKRADAKTTFHFK